MARLLEDVRDLRVVQTRELSARWMQIIREATSDDLSDFYAGLLQEIDVARYAGKCPPGRKRRKMHTAEKPARSYTESFPYKT